MKNTTQGMGLEKRFSLVVQPIISISLQLEGKKETQAKELIERTKTNNSWVVLILLREKNLDS